MDRTHPNVALRSMTWAPGLPVPWVVVELAWRMVRIAVLLVIAAHLIDERVPDCGMAVKHGSFDAAISVCSRELAETHDPATGVRLADLFRIQGQRVAARGLAGLLIGSSAQPQALRVLANLARREHRLDEAAVLLAAAIRQRAPDDHPSLAYDARAGAEVEVARGHYGPALRAFAQCIAHAKQADPPDEIEYTCHLGAANALRHGGAWDHARRELDAARAVMPDGAREQMLLAFTQGNLEQDIGVAGLAAHDHQARGAFLSAATFNLSAHDPDHARSIEANLADIYTSLGALDMAEAHLALANALDLDHEYARSYALISARIAFARGDHPRARAWAAYADEAFDDTRLEADDREDLSVIRMRIALADHDAPSAEAWSEIAVASAERVRAAESVLELRPGILAKLHLAYELRFAVLARAGRAEDAVLALDRWQGRTVLDALATPPPALAGLEAEAARGDSLDSWLPIATEAGFAAAPDPERIRAALRQLDFIALVVADGEVWRVTALHGDLAIRDLGALAMLAPALERFTLHPEDAAVATSLGDQLLDRRAVRRTDEALHVLLDGPLAALPIAALRPAGDLLIAARPLIQVLRVPDVACVDVAPITHATIVADASGNLPAATSEAGALARTLPIDMTVQRSSAATSAALLAAPPDGLIHVAVHGRVDGDGGALVLHDRAVSALELAARRLRASLVVLSVCDAAQAADPEHFGSLVSGFLAGGTPQVIATTRVVTDAGARDLASRLYRHGALVDPVRALRAVQLDRAAAHNLDWPRFAVFGHDRCSFTP